MRTKQQPPVQWLSLPALWQRTKGQVLAHVVGRFVDPRTRFAPLDASVELLDTGDAGAGDVWVDYVSDVGDGYQATRAVAFCQSRPLGDTRPGSVLIFGGDQVYPVASRTAYDRRFRAPYDDLLVQRQGVLSLPGNHDWYDMLKAFPEIFTRGGSAALPNAAQRCSYWSWPVPGGTWWIWGLDFGLTGVLDEAQRSFFTGQRDELAALDRPIGLVICTAEPYWQKGKAAMAERVEALIPPNASSVLHLSGDKHHLAVWQDDAVAALERERIYVTAGGGGAYLSLTDDVPAAVPLHPAGPAAGGVETAAQQGAAPQLPRRDVYPEPGAWKALDLAPALAPRGWRLDQLGLLPVLGAAYTGLGGLLALAAADRAPSGLSGLEWASRGSWPAAWWRLLGAAARNGWCRVGAVGVLIACLLVALENGKRSRVRRAALGAAHATAHGAAVVGVAAAAMEVATWITGAWRGVVYVLGLGLVGSFVGNAIVVGYLAVAARRGFNLNDAAAAIASPHRKSFVRLRFSPDGVLDVIPFTVERTDVEPAELLASCQRRISYRLVPGRRPRPLPGAGPSRASVG